MSAPPYMKLYIADYLADTTHLTRDQHGAYLLLLMAMWRAGGKLPNNDEKLAAIVKASPKDWATLRSILIEFFKIRGGAIRHKRLSKELAHYKTISLRRSEAKNAIHSETAKENNELAKPFVGITRTRTKREGKKAPRSLLPLPVAQAPTSEPDGSSPSRSEVIDLDKLRDEIAEAERLRQLRVAGQ